MADPPRTKIVLITRADESLGFDIANKLASDHRDYHIIMSGRKKEALDHSVQALRSKGYSVEGQVLELDSEESMDNIVQIITQKHGRVDVLINNATARVSSPMTVLHPKANPDAHESPPGR
ncbi:hypothetical protein QBC44DRAFT_371423 [Cladorrhinum sp. PSN332]|nr:hypothetical protein QBC44DRAFT_371423 [Cladorrhinum sp. PSN332]